MTDLKQLHEALKQLSLSQNATQFYLASYKQGPASIGSIALSTNMDRSSAYLAAQQLQAVGLLDEDITAKRKTVHAKPPAAVLARLRTRIRSMKRNAELVEDALPELLAAFNQESPRPVLQFFSGKKGLDQISEDVLAHAEKEFLLLSNQKEERRVFTTAENKEFIEERKHKGIRVRVIAPDTAEAHELAKKDASNLRETRILTGKIPFTTETYIYGDRVAMLSFNKRIIGFTVHSKEFAQTQRFLFESLWNTLE